MGIFREIPPTAGWPFYIRDFPALFTVQGSLEHDFCSYLNVSYAKVTNSGTTAFYIILEALKTVSSKKKVIIPSYVCPLVALAVRRAGLEVVVCDITKEGFNYQLKDLEALCAQNDVLAVVVVHLAGLAVDFDAIKSLVGKQGVFLIEDCAQSLGAEYKGRPVGALGDASFFSLARGKGMTAYEGGLIVTDNPVLAEAIKKKEKELVINAPLAEALKIFELFGYWIFYRSLLAWFVFGLPRLFWKLNGRELKAGGEDFELEFPVHSVSKLRRQYAHVTFPRLKEMLGKQRKSAEILIQGLSGIKGIRVVKEDVSTRASYPYLVVVFEDIERRDRVLCALEKKGLGVSRAYMYAICDYDYLKGFVQDKNCQNGRWFAEASLTLTTSIFLKERDISYIIKQISVL